MRFSYSSSASFGEKEGVEKGREKVWSIYLDVVLLRLDLRPVYSPIANHVNDTNGSIDYVHKEGRVRDDLSELDS